MVRAARVAGHGAEREAVSPAPGLDQGLDATAGELEGEQPIPRRTADGGLRLQKQKALARERGLVLHGLAAERLGTEALQQLRRANQGVEYQHAARVEALALAV